jgi:hypothetical protein
VTLLERVEPVEIKLTPQQFVAKYGKFPSEKYYTEDQYYKLRREDGYGEEWFAEYGPNSTSQPPEESM